MLIKVNETTWVRANAVNQIYISRDNVIDEHKHCFSVIVQTDYDDYRNIFDTFKEAEQFATRLANIINFEEAKSS